MFNNSPAPSRNPTVYEIMCKNYGTTRQDTADNRIRRMRFSWWITEATDTHTEYVTLIAFPRGQWLCERASVLCLYVNFLRFIVKIVILNTN